MYSSSLPPSFCMTFITFPTEVSARQCSMFSTYLRHGNKFSSPMSPGLTWPSLGSLRSSCHHFLNLLGATVLELGGSSLGHEAAVRAWTGGNPLGTPPPAFIEQFPWHER